MPEGPCTLLFVETNHILRSIGKSPLHLCRQETGSPDAYRNLRAPQQGQSMTLRRRSAGGLHRILKEH
jgi:hypothetical protein